MDDLKLMKRGQLAKTLGVNPRTIARNEADFIQKGLVKVVLAGAIFYTSKSIRVFIENCKE